MGKGGSMGIVLLIVLFASAMLGLTYSSSTNSTINVSTSTICQQSNPCSLTSIPPQINATSVGQAVNIVTEIINWVINLLKTVRSLV